MPFRSTADIRYFVFDSFQEGLSHAVFTRQGGVSQGYWASLNVGGTVGDDPRHVGENRLRAFATLDRDPATLFDVWQVHGTAVVIADAPRRPETPHLQADAILTDKPGVSLMMRFADCVPIFLFDPLHQVVGIAHAGWMGTVKGTVSAAVMAMRDHYGSEPADVLAAIGPSIGPDHYEIGPDVENQVRQAFGLEASGLLSERSGRTYLDLWAANRLLLEHAGLHHIEEAGLCTACHTQDWYSHRAEKGRTGRFGAMIGLKS